MDHVIGLTIFAGLIIGMCVILCVAATILGPLVAS
jgi:hypothetical protein